MTPGLVDLGTSSLALAGKSDCALACAVIPSSTIKAMD